MAGPVYGTRDGVHKRGAPRGILADSARQIASVDTLTNRLSLEAHGFALNDTLQFAVDPGGELPSPLSLTAVYYAIPVTDSESLFQVASAVDGAAVNLLDEGSGSFAVAASSGPVIDAALEYYSRYADRHAPAHVVPFEEPYPSEIVDCVETLAAAKVMRHFGRRSELIFESAAIAERELKALLKGLPLRDSAATAPSNLAVAEAVNADARGWGSSSGGCIP